MLVVSANNPATKTVTLPLPSLKSARLLDQVRERVRYLHYNMRTEQAYVYWARAFIRFHKRRTPAKWAVLGVYLAALTLVWIRNEFRSAL